MAGIGRERSSKGGLDGEGAVPGSMDRFKNVQLLATSVIFRSDLAATEPDPLQSPREMTD